MFGLIVFISLMYGGQLMYGGFDHLFFNMGPLGGNLGVAYSPTSVVFFAGLCSAPSAAQYNWIKKSGNLNQVPKTVTSLNDHIFKKLKPGDLLFWSHTYKPTDGRTNGITHVQMYLGKEKKDGRPVMIGSSDGRSYRGKQQDGYAVFDLFLF